MNRLTASIPWVSAIFNFGLATLTIIPDFVVQIDPIARISITILSCAVGLVFLVILYRQRRLNKSMNLTAAHSLLSIVLKYTVSSGNARVTLFREEVNSEDGTIEFARVLRVAYHPALSVDGTERIKANESVLRAASDLELGDENAAPVDERQGFPLERESRDRWLKEQREFVGNRAESLRMKSSAYAWRRISIPDDVDNGVTHLLLIESTSPRGIDIRSLGEKYIDSIVAEALRAQGK